MAAKVKHDEAIKLLGDAWSLYRRSFKANERELLECFEGALRACLDKMSLMDLDSIYEVFRDLGNEERSVQIVDQYLKVLAQQGRKIDKRQLYRWPKDAYLSSELDKYIVESKAEKLFEDYTIPHVGTNGLNSGDYIKLSQASVESFYDFFKSLDD
ncbi:MULTISPECIES: hypothetical protein [Pseudomonas]|uniref:hypothetical protein n=1 Tax=Pseudomonas TaxID=286 RepID=UPI000EC41E07|nr:hypothetical protein [Pseudomonas sp.]